MSGLHHNESRLVGNVPPGPTSGLPHSQRKLEKGFSGRWKGYRSGTPTVGVSRSVCVGRGRGRGEGGEGEMLCGRLGTGE